MVVGLGLDIVDISRITASLERFGDKFLEKLLTPLELLTLPKNPIAYTAARFAAKEAAVKALGTGFAHGISPHHIEVRKDAAGKPSLYFYEPCKIHLEQLKVTNIHLSLSHSQKTAAAVVILESVL